MNAIKIIAAAAAVAIGFSAADAQQVEGSITVFENSFHSGSSITFYNVNPPAYSTKVCFNIDGCFNDRASSARWNLRFNAELAFFKDRDCVGQYRAWPANIDYNFPVDFAYDGINDVISSIGFPVKDYYANADIRDVCSRPWLYVTETNTTALNAAEKSSIVGLNKTDSVVKESV